jgi:formylglycine-generating enzyme required for sulfatase activity
MVMRAGTFALAGVSVLSAAGCLTVLGIDNDYSRGDPDAGAPSTGGTGGDVSSSAGGDGGAGTGASASASTSSSGTGAAGGAGGGAAGGAWGGGGASAGCPNGAGPTMVDVGGYCIDSTEVTRGHYQDFLNTGVATQAETGMPAYCAFNDDYTPNGNWPPNALELVLPVVNVDWCDAYAYCEWAGKRLCGAIGGGQLDQGDSADASASQWFRACSNGGTTTYTFGSAFLDVCNVGGTGPEPVGANLECHGTMAPWEAVFDLTGNVREWEDACEANVGPGDNCNRRGGSHPSNPNTAQCDNLSGGLLQTRASTTDTTGLRCCADL